MRILLRINIRILPVATSAYPHIRFLPEPWIFTKAQLTICSSVRIINYKQFRRGFTIAKNRNVYIFTPAKRKQMRKHNHDYGRGRLKDTRLMEVKWLLETG